MIRLSRLTDYAVTLLTQMVREEKELWTASDLAERTSIPLPTVSKILKLLVKAQVALAQRGNQGGYKLARAGRDISIAAVIEALDGPIALTDCAEGSDQACRAEPVCPMSGNWNKVNRAVREALEAVSLVDMTTSASGSLGKPSKTEEEVHP